MTVNGDDWFFCPPYVSKRWTIAQVDQGYVDVAPIQCPKLWRLAFKDRKSIVSSDFHTLWQVSKTQLSDGTEFRSDQVGIEIQTMFPDGSFSSFGIAVKPSAENSGSWVLKANNYLLEICDGDVPFCGLIGVLAPSGTANSRPCVTLLVSGPGGGTEAAQIIRQALIDRGVSSSIIGRANRSGSIGIVKVPFFPEIYVRSSEHSFGIDWKFWRPFFQNNREYEWNFAGLIWCDAVNSAITDIRNVIPLMIDKVFYEDIFAFPFDEKNFNNDDGVNPDLLNSIADTPPFQWL